MKGKFYCAKTSHKSANIICEVKKSTYVVWYYRGNISNVELLEDSNLPKLIKEGTYVLVSKRRAKELMKGTESRSTTKRRVRR